VFPGNTGFLIKICTFLDVMLSGNTECKHTSIDTEKPESLGDSFYFDSCLMTVDRNQTLTVSKVWGYTHVG
jgi:hypothetical protein